MPAGKVFFPSKKKWPDSTLAFEAKGVARAATGLASYQQGLAVVHSKKKEKKKKKKEKKKGKKRCIACIKERCVRQRIMPNNPAGCFFSKHRLATPPPQFFRPEDAPKKKKNRKIFFSLPD